MRPRSSARIGFGWCVVAAVGLLVFIGLAGQGCDRDGPREAVPTLARPVVAMDWPDRVRCEIVEVDRMPRGGFLCNVTLRDASDGSAVGSGLIFTKPGAEIVQVTKTASGEWPGLAVTYRPTGRWPVTWDLGDVFECDLQGQRATRR